jgi:hypothetical protein
MNPSREAIFENLDNAKENGYFEPGEYLHEHNAEDLAIDMMCYAEDCETSSVEYLKPFIQEWLDNNE